MSSNVHEFAKDLKRGKKGEAEFEQLFGDLVRREDGYLQDFTVLADGTTIELKTDYWDPTKTENVFMERWSYKDQDGGPWQSLRKGITYYIYFFPKTMQFHCFEVKALVKELDKLCKDMFIINIYNRTHTTQGYKVKRADLEHLELNLEKLLKGRL